jgi:isopentenyl-diphosphate Delta-isomerase
VEKTPDEEFLEVVDEQNRVIGLKSRRRIHRESLRHRSVHIFVFNSREELYLQRRSLHKDQYPDHWDSSAAGHADPGESPLETAQRELLEELNLKEPLTELLHYPACLETGWEFVTLFTAWTDHPIALNLHEASSGHFFSAGQLSALLKNQQEKTAPGFRLLYSLYQERVLRDKD